MNPYDTEGARVSAEGKALREWERANAEDDALDVIANKIGSDDAKLIAAIRNANWELRICDAITIEARAELERERAMADPEGSHV